MKKLLSLLIISIYFFSINSYSQELTNENSNETFDYLYFKASWVDKSQNKVEVRWATVIEKNCALYEVQKSTDKASWVTISKIEGQGTIDLLTMYFAMDKNPEYYPTVNFYRLKQVDTNGISHYSKYIEVLSNPVNENTVVVTDEK